MPREAIPINRATKMQCLNYKYHINVGQIDIKLYIESFFTKGRTDMMAMSHKQIVVMEEPESTTLVQEYEHLPELMEAANHEDGLSLVGKVPERNVLILEEHPQEQSEEPSVSNERDLSDYYTAHWSESGEASAKRQKRTQGAPEEAMAQSAPAKHMPKEAAFTAINLTEHSTCPSANNEPQDAVSASQIRTSSRELPTNRPTYSMQHHAPCISSLQVYMPENNSASRVLQVCLLSLASLNLQ
jgi:hypothetical protein